MENKPYAHQKTHLHTMKVYNTRPVPVGILIILIKIERINILSNVSATIAIMVSFNP